MNEMSYDYNFISTVIFLVLLIYKLENNKKDAVSIYNNHIFYEINTKHFLYKYIILKCLVSF